MKLKKMTVENFRRFSKKTSLNFEETMLFVGKNNSGKTSLFELFEKFLSDNRKFELEDFSVGEISNMKIEELYNKYCFLEESIKNNNLPKDKINEIDEMFPSIKFELFIELDNNDSLSDIKELLFEFENNNSILLIGKFRARNSKSFFQYYEEYNQLLSSIENDKDSREVDKIKLLTLYEYFQRNYMNLYTCEYYTSKEGMSEMYTVESRYVKNLFNICFIKARRDVDDTSEQKNQNISLALWNYYVNLKENNIANKDYFKTTIDSIGFALNTKYNDIFSELMEYITSDIFTNEMDTTLEIISDFEIDDMLKKNSTLKYSIKDIKLPESYNGLGYSNLIYIFIQIYTFKKKIEQNIRPFNILFLEEPESHLHPQVQQTIFKKLENIFNSNDKLYKIISTHSSYILKNASIDMINYFYINDYTVEIKSLSEYIEKNLHFKTFLIKYFEVSTCDLFFADKAIFIEGTVERLLIPKIISKIDSLDENNNLGKQHITILEVGGAYAHIFYDLLDFLKIKYLVITDIDSVDIKNVKAKCDITLESESNKALKTSNSVIKNWFDIQNSDLFIYDLVANYKTRSIKIIDGKETCKISFQIPNSFTEMIWGRTLEEQFILENIDLIFDDFNSSNTNDNYKLIYTTLYNSYKKVMKKNNEDIINIRKEDIKTYFFEVVDNIKKTDFAFDIICKTDEWIVPTYIKDGLLWLMK